MTSQNSIQYYVELSNYLGCKLYEFMATLLIQIYNQDNGYFNKLPISLSFTKMAIVPDSAKFNINMIKGIQS